MRVILLGYKCLLEITGLELSRAAAFVLLLRSAVGVREPSFVSSKFLLLVVVTREHDCGVARRACAFCKATILGPRSYILNCYGYRCYGSKDPDYSSFY